MPQDTRLAFQGEAPYMVTNSDTDRFTLQNLAAHPIWVIATAGTDAPADNLGGLRVLPNELILNGYLSELFPGVPGANRVWVWGFQGTVSVKISHA